MKDEYYNRYIIKGNLFGPVIDAFIHNNGRYNLLDSAFWDMLEFIKMVWFGIFVLFFVIRWDHFCCCFF